MASRELWQYFAKWSRLISNTGEKAELEKNANEMARGLQPLAKAKESLVPNVIREIAIIGSKKGPVIEAMIAPTFTMTVRKGVERARKATAEVQVGGLLDIGAQVRLPLLA